ncbi:MAG: ABC transporter permease [Blautia sp.]|nr:ABC transporter permease [Blautia sp.]MDD5966904.1 ABC transporter permease [Blautia sp.]MDY2898836.1 ABC transporter permease [Candidatus Limivivens sp.]SCG88687.1 Oligopeptide transport system permease protein oppB [uncultured Clostridium sp.]
MQTSRYIVKRILLALVSLFAIITITYFLMNLMPGDPFMSEKASEENRAILIAKYGLDQPVYVQYGKYLTNLLHGDMGTSYVLQKGRAVKDIIFESFQISMSLGVRALLLAIVCGIILGCIAGLCKDKLPDAVIRVLSSVGISMPGYVIASGLMILLAVNLKVLPVNYNKPGGWLMPMLTLAIYPTSYLTRLTRASILEVMNQDYLRTERAKGMSEFVVVFIHALKNSLIPVITYLGPLTASILTGGFVAESVFSVPGLGRYFVSSISSRDYTMIMGVTIFYSALIVFMNLICDILYKIVDPRIQLD